MTSGDQVNTAQSAIAAEIASQPDTWRRAAARLPEFSGLPQPGESVALI